MSGPDASRRHHVKESVTSRRAALGRAPEALRQVPDTPFLIALTEDERLHGLELFAHEGPATKQPQKEEVRIYERVPAHVGSVAPPPERRFERATPPARPTIRSPQVWVAPLAAAVLTVVVVVFGVMAPRVVRTTASGPTATANDRIAVRTKAPDNVSATTAAAVLPAGGTTSPPSTAIDAPVRPETPALRAPARSTPISSAPDAPRIRPDPPIVLASASGPVAAAPLPIMESAIAPLLDSPRLPVNLSVAPRSVVAVPVTLPRAEASEAAVLRLPSPETAIQTVLGQYRTAYRDLDAGAARAIWPSVDSKALRKAFDRLEQQDLIFDSCQIAITDVRAVASCQGFAWYVPRIGNKDPHHDQRQWEFKLTKVDDAWLLDTVSAR